jgi:hypothetical protein
MVGNSPPFLSNCRGARQLLFDADCPRTRLFRSRLPALYAVPGAFFSSTRFKQNQPDIISLKQQYGTSSASTLARLQRDRPDGSRGGTPK